MTAYLSWLLQRAGYWVRPYDMVADRRRWWWQPPTPCDPPATYLYEVRAVVDGEPEGAPAEVTFDAATNDLSWPKVPGAVAYEIYRGGPDWP